MLRSYLARPRALLSHHRHRWRPPVDQLRPHADRIPSRCYASSEEDDTDVDQPAAPAASAYRYGCAFPDHHRRQHLYVVLDDWNKGFSIHKFDLDDRSDMGGDLAVRPPVHRQEKQQHGICWNFAALGSKIVAAGSLNYEDDFVTIVYDTKTAGVSIAPRLPVELYGPWTLAAAMENNSLYVFEPSTQSTRWTGRCTVPSSIYQSDDAPKPGYHETNWSWTSIIPAEPPFNISGAKSSALHLETLFVSAGQWEWNPANRNRELLKLGDREPPRKLFTLGSRFHSTYTSHTFSYNAGRDEWRRLGDWELPFYGRAHYNVVLDVWVGLHMAPFRHMPDGYVCACDVVPPDGCSTQPNSKLSTENLFDPDAERHLSASLVHTGDMNYCLVEVVKRQTFMRERSVLAGGNKCTLRMSTFRLQYGKNGELTVTSPRSERFYRFSRFDSGERVQVLHAFWM